MIDRRHVLRLGAAASMLGLMPARVRGVTGDQSSNLVSPAALGDSIIGMLYDALTTGDEAWPQPAEDKFFTWMRPGLPFANHDFEFLTQGLTGVLKREAMVPGESVTPETINRLRATDAAKMMLQAEQLSRVCDFVPEVTSITNKQFAQFTASENEGSLSDRYKLILTMSQVMRSELSEDTKQRIIKFRQLLRTTTKKKDLVTGQEKDVIEPSPLVVAYNDRMANYINAAFEYNQRRLSALAGNNSEDIKYFATNGNLLRTKVHADYDDWVINGYKNDYEQIAAFIDQLTARDPSLWKQEYKDNFSEAALLGLNSGASFYYTALVPGDFPEKGGWSEFTFDASDFQRYSDASVSGSGWSVSAAASYFGIGASGGVSDSEQKQPYDGKFDLNRFRLRFSVCQVPIVRPWFHPDFIVSKAWRFDEGNPLVKEFKGIVSDGGHPPSGLIPAYPTTALFVRHLQLDFGENSSFSDYYGRHSTSSEEGGLNISFGPFSLGGKANHWSKDGYSKQNYSAHMTQQSISVPGIQLIGFKCHMLPKCPDPDPSIKDWI